MPKTVILSTARTPFGKMGGALAPLGAPEHTDPGKAIGAVPTGGKVKAIDPKLPSVTVLTDDGKTVTMKVADKKNIEGLKVGDKIDITYTEALMISVK